MDRAKLVCFATLTPRVQMSLTIPLSTSPYRQRTRRLRRPMRTSGRLTNAVWMRSVGFAEGQGWGRGGWAKRQLSSRTLCPQVANHVVQALLNQKVSGFRNISHPPNCCRIDPGGGGYSQEV